MSNSSKISNTSTTANDKAAAKRERERAYIREYRRKNPEKVKRWQEDAIIRQAERILARRAAEAAAKAEAGEDGDHE